MRELFKEIKGIFVAILLIAIFVAALSRFNYNIVEMFMWIVNTVLDLIQNLADKISNIELFKRLVN